MNASLTRFIQVHIMQTKLMRRGNDSEMCFSLLKVCVKLTQNKKNYLHNVCTTGLVWIFPTFALSLQTYNQRANLISNPPNTPKSLRWPYLCNQSSVWNEPKNRFNNRHCQTVPDKSRYIEQDPMKYEIWYIKMRSGPLLAHSKTKITQFQQKRVFLQNASWRATGASLSLFGWPWPIL